MRAQRASSIAPLTASAFVRKRAQRSSLRERQRDRGLRTSAATILPVRIDGLVHGIYLGRRRPTLISDGDHGPPWRESGQCWRSVTTRDVGTVVVERAGAVHSRRNVESRRWRGRKGNGQATRATKESAVSVATRENGYAEQWAKPIHLITDGRRLPNANYLAGLSRKNEQKATSDCRIRCTARGVGNRKCPPSYRLREAKYWFPVSYHASVCSIRCAPPSLEPSGAANERA
jgi:hypothetical protein